MKELGSLINRFIKQYWLMLVGVLLLQLAATAASLSLPTLNAEIIDNGVAKGDTGYIWRHGGFMLAVSLVQVVGQIGAVYLGARAAMAMGRDIRSAIFSHAMNFSTRELNQFGAPSLLTRTTNDVQQVQMIVLMTLIMMISAPITMVGGVFMGLQQDVTLSWIVLVAVVVLAISVGGIAARMVPVFGLMQTRTDHLNRVLREQISGIRVVRAFVREPYERTRFEHANSDVTDAYVRVGRLFAFLFPTVMAVLGLSGMAVMWFGGKRLDAGDMQVGQLTAFLQYLMQILFSVVMASMMLVMAPRAIVSARRINEVLRTESSVVVAPNPVTELDSAGNVSLVDVEFAYPGADQPVICGINFDLAPGRTTAVIGATGSGKTTLVNLIPRLFDATGGTVSVDGVDVRDLHPEALWARVGLVPQKPYLFSGTVASNLRYGKPDATDEEMWHALEVAQAADFVSDMDGQLDAPIAQGGTNVSGGQRQRLSIARALIKRPEVYIFDDSFSALDVGTDARLRAALAKETSDAAVLIVAQRVSTIRGADEILVLEHGEIVGRGTHDELLAMCPTYVEIVESQASVEDAA